MTIEKENMATQMCKGYDGERKERKYLFGLLDLASNDQLYNL